MTRPDAVVVDVDSSSSARQALDPTLSSRATSGALWLLIDVAGVQGLSLVVFAIIARYVSASDVGLISIAFVMTQSCKVLLIDVVSIAVARKKDPTSLEYTTGFWLTTTMSFIVMVVIACSAGWLERLFHAPGLRPVMVMMSTTVFLLSLSCTHESWLARHFQFKPLALRALTGSVAGAVVGIVLAVRGFGVIALVAQQLAMTLTSMTLLWLICPWRPEFAFSTIAAREIIRFGRSLLASSGLSILSQNGDTALVASFFGPVGAGVYSIGRRVRLALLMVAWGPLNGVILPMFAELQSDRGRLQRGILRSFTLISAACAPLFFGIAAIANEAVPLIFGQKWMAAAPVVAVLAVGGLAQILIMHNERIFITQARPSWCLLISLLYVVLAVPAFLLLGAESSFSVALPFVLPYIIVLPASMYLALTLVGITPRDCFAAMSPGIAASTLMLFAVHWMAEYLHVSEAALRILILSGAGLIIYVCLLALIGRRALFSVWEFTLHVLGLVRR